jgi:hypothetical protein
MITHGKRRKMVGGNKKHRERGGYVTVDLLERAASGRKQRYYNLLATGNYSWAVSSSC